MKKLFAALTIALLAQAAHADVLTIDFTTRYDRDSGVITTVDPAARLTLSLNGDGSVTAKLDTLNAQAWYGAAVDADWHDTVSDVTQGHWSGWGTHLGDFSAGVVCLGGCSGSAAWTINGTMPFTSVAQVLNGDQSPYDAFFFNAEGEYAGMAAETAAVPEPASLALLGLGLASVGIARRRIGSDSGSTQRA